MNIGILEICSATHFTPVITRAKLFNVGGNNIKIFVNEEMLENLTPLIGKNNITIITLKFGESRYKFLKNIEKTYKFDLFFITTLLPSVPAFWFFNPKKTGAKSIVTLHSLNIWFNPFQFNGLRSLVLYVICRLWMRRIDYISVGLDIMKIYMNNELKSKIKAVVIPHTIFDENDFKSELNGKICEDLDPADNFCINVVIPGIYSTKRRNYQEVFNALEGLSIQDAAKIRLELLGAPKSKEQDIEGGLSILNSSRRLQLKGYNVISYDFFLSRDDFNRQINLADLILSPININGVEGETYGLSKDTGTFSDIVDASIPGIIPTGLRVPEKLSSSVLHFEKFEEIFEIISDLINNPKKLMSLKMAAKENSKKYSIEEVRVDVFQTLGIHTSINNK